MSKSSGYHVTDPATGEVVQTFPVATDAEVEAAVAASVTAFAEWRTTPIRDYRDFARYDARYGHAHWLYQHNGGVFLPPWGKMEQWTMSVQHTTEDVDRFVANLETFARELREGVAA